MGVESRMVFTFASNVTQRTMQLASILGNVDNVGKGHHMPHFRQEENGGLTTAMKASSKSVPGHRHSPGVCKIPCYDLAACCIWGRMLNPPCVRARVLDRVKQ